MLLSQAKEKRIYRISKIEDRKEVKLKLTSMGLYSGVIIKIIKNDYSGPIILGLNIINRVSIGRGLTQKIEVEEYNE